MKVKEFRQAIDLYNESISIEEDSATFANRAQAYLKLKDYRRCIEDANKALSLKSDYVKAYFRRGQAYQFLEKFEDAIADF